MTIYLITNYTKKIITLHCKMSMDCSVQCCILKFACHFIKTLNHIVMDRSSADVCTESIYQLLPVIFTTKK